ncbi:TetR/AcrR family transcriptional regulator [Streptomyces adustus]|uniref:TetR/AcrR family transcriptional regulator n=1 Tax=Streptomyces adustus TaxID=1609272 RepID=A0A5N8V5B8_9ACTN|nr:TetR/AcrR family transcriptional regulator [Streptomyces adustus]MPY30373.1 TetR/AcrR family transcriptional regulator [Streptomyces adustus]
MSAEKSPETRERILRAAARLLAEGGSEALSTRAVCAAAGVQAPTLYRVFGDKDGLLDAVAGYGFERYLAEKHSLAPTEDPVEDLRRGWDMHVDFGLTHPAFYVLMYGTVRPGHRPAAAEDAYALLRAMLERTARAGRLRIPVDAAAQTIQATSAGVTLALISSPADARDRGLSVRVRDTVLASVTTEARPAAPASGDAVPVHALALNAALGDRPTALGSTETVLLREWLERLATSE